MLFPRAIGIFLCLVLLALSAGCFPKKTLPPEAVRPGETASSLLRRAELAWQARNHVESARIYGQLAWGREQEIDPRLLPVIRNRLVQSLLQTRDYSRAEQALRLWAEGDPSVQGQWFWHDYHVRSLLGQGLKAEAVNHLTRLMQQPDAAWELRYAAGVQLVELHGQARAFLPMADILNTLFAMAPEDQTRVELERMVMHMAKGLSEDELQALVGDMPAEELLVFPYSVFFWEQQRRLASHDPRAWTDVRASLQRLLQRGEWADRAPLSSELSELERDFGLPGPTCLGLVLPLDGPLAETGWKILRGAEAGRTTLALEGLDIQLEVLNSLVPDLAQNIRDLDAHCTVIGGPLQRETWERIHEHGLHRERAFFAFLPSLGDHQEGRDAWRFFSSPQDQVRTLSELTVHALGFFSAGVLYPEDRFGQYMAQLFTQEMEDQGGIVRRAQGYSPTGHGEWGQAVASLLGVQAQQRRGRAQSVQLPNPGFQALFIPDSLTQAEMLVPQLFYYDEQRLLLLGPELWSQAWGRRAEQIESQYFRLAVMPGAWWPDNPSPAAEALRRTAESSGASADFWMALGYDFARWGATLSHGQTLGGGGMNALLHTRNDFPWSMAPLQWNAEGIAQQDLYLFQPSPSAAGGLSILDLAALRARLEQVRGLR